MLLHNEQNMTYLIGYLWSAPEILMTFQGRSKGTKTGDVYSFGLIIFEIFLKQVPYEHLKLPATGKTLLFSTRFAQPNLES